MDASVLRKMMREHYRQCDIIFAEWVKSGYSDPPPTYPPFPEECRGMTCGAKTRAGTPCKRKDLYTNGRCRLHGGLSTGPKTKEGKRRSALNGWRPKRKKQTP
jgi:hypothetical protein